MPKLLDIITHPNDILRKRSKSMKKSEINTKEFQKFFCDMKLTMKKKDGVGLAAPQIGKNIRVIVVSTNEGEIAMINPKILKKSFKKEWGEEGCLSVPKTFGDVRRHKKIKFCFLNTEGMEKLIEAEGFFARVVQHEIDHLDGILFIDKAKSIKKIE